MSRNSGTRLTTASQLPLATKQISSEEARRALFIDFEGRTDEAPVLLGVLYGTGRGFAKTVLVDYLLDPLFWQLEDACKIPSELRHDTKCQPLGQALNEIIRQARSKDRLIVSWSQHDMQKVLEQGLDGMLADEFALRYRDGKATAKRWYRKFHSDTLLPAKRFGGRHSLANYMDLIEYQVPHEKFGINRTGDNLKVIRDAVETCGSWDALTDRQRERWIEVVGHNEYDCHALGEIVAIAATDLETGQSSIGTR